VTRFQAADISAILDAAGVSGYALAEESKLGLVLRIDSATNLAVLDALKTDEAAFTQLLDLFGADIEGHIEVTYRLRSMQANVDLVVKSELPYDGTLPSVTSLFASALLPERELCELFGLYLEGHPNPKRLLTTEGLPPFLRKEVAIRGREDFWPTTTK
jgi:NADH:ubiquinone oxidoreductase subunit C